MGVYLVENNNSIARLFEGWEETFIWSYLQGCMGIAYADSLAAPESVQISLGGFCFLAGAVNEDLIRNRPENLNYNYVTLVSENQGWERAIEALYKEKALRQIRYATKKEKGVFCKEKLEEIVSTLPAEYEIVPIHREEYEKILSTKWSEDICINYSSYEEFEKMGLGFAIMRDGEIVSGASAYTYFIGGIEIEIDTRKDERRKGLASVCGARLILECLERDLYPSWDAYNRESLALAEKLGYSFDREYPVYLVKF